MRKKARTAKKQYKRIAILEYNAVPRGTMPRRRRVAKLLKQQALYQLAKTNYYLGLVKDDRSVNTPDVISALKQLFNDYREA